MAARGLFSGSTAGFESEVSSEIALEISDRKFAWSLAPDTSIVADAGLDCKVSQAKFTFL